MNTLVATIEVRCPFSAAIEYIDDYHRRRTEPHIVPYAQVARHVHCEAGEIRDVTDATRVHEALLFRWSSRFPFLPPLVHGLITVRPNAPSTQIRLEATYVPRFGFVGRLIDVFIGRALVRRTLRTFLDDVRRFVENAYERERENARRARVKATK
jgi:hypothetical protein